MMEEDEGQRILCRFCSRSFSSRNSLGGHMRVHYALLVAEKCEEEDDNGDLGFGVEEEMEIPLSSDLGVEDLSEVAYGLRENPKKSWRISDTEHEGLMKLNLCKQCGKGFVSSRALSGHMRSHSVKGKGEGTVCKECGKGFGSMRAMFGHMKSHSKKLTKGFGSMRAMFGHMKSHSKKLTKGLSESDEDGEASCLIRKKRSRTRCNKISSKPYDLNVASSSISTVVENDEVKAAAMCLMILSRGRRSWDEFGLIGNLASDHNSSVSLEAQVKAGNDARKIKQQREKVDICVVGYLASGEEVQGEVEVSVDESVSCGIFDKKIYPTQLVVNNECRSEVGLDQDDKVKKLGHFVGQDFELKENPRDQKIQNATDDSDFLQDVGNKRKFMRTTTSEVVDSCIELKVEERCGFNEAYSELQKLKSNEDSFGQEMSGVKVGSYALKKRSKKYECSICFKVFASGQALGGHKRAHFSGKEIALMDQELPARTDNNLDVNFPETMEEESTIDVGLKPWWAGYNREWESLAIYN